MLEISVKQETLREVVELLSSVVSEAKITITSDGIKAKVVDPSHVMMLTLDLNKAALEAFQAPIGEENIGLDVEKLKAVLRLSKPGSILRLSEQKSRIAITFGNFNRQMAVIDPTGLPDTKVPSVTPPTTIAVKVEDLLQAIRGSEAITDHAELSVDPEKGFTVKAKGENDIVELTIPKVGLSMFDAKEAVSSLFPLDMFASMVKAIPSTEIRLGLGNAYPLRVEFDFAEGNGKGVFLLAPRVEE